MLTVEWEPREYVNKPFQDYFDNQSRYLIFYGGRGSSKSDFATKKLIYRCLNEPYFRCILIRNTYAAIKDSSYQSIKDTIISLGLYDLFEFKLQPLEIHCVNGNCFLARGCDDTQKIKSLKDASAVWWEEDIPSESDFITITTSIRTIKATYLQEIFTINPEVEGNYQDHWFWKRFFKDHHPEKTFSGKTHIKVDENSHAELTYSCHHSTYKDNPFLPDEYKAFLMDLKLKNPYYWEVYCNGNWGNKVFGGLFYKCFDVGKNTLNWTYDPNIPLHISFDFNVNPYMSCSVWQMNGGSVYLIDEIAMKYPNNRTKDTCWEFTRRYNNHKSGLFVYGDPSGRAESTKTEAGWNEYSIITKELEKFRPTLRLLSVAPNHKLRGDFINSIFEGSVPDVRIYINEKSVYLKNDLMFGKEDHEGYKLKEKHKDENGVQSEKYHHFSDCFVGETLIKTSKGNTRIDMICVGDYVLTRRGYRRVLSFMNKGGRPVKKYKIGCNEITCTNDHKFWANGAFIKIQHLIGWNIMCVFDKKSGTWKKKLCFIKELSLHDTLIQKKGQKGYTFQEHLKEKAHGFTDTNTSRRLVKYLKTALFIIKTAILLITISTIWSVFAVINTLKTTQTRAIGLKYLNKVFRCLQGQNQSSGTNQKTEENGTQNTQKKYYKLELLTLSVLSVARWFLNMMSTAQSIAAANVNQNTGQGLTEDWENGTRTGFVWCVRVFSQFINGTNQNAVLENAGHYTEKVYDIMVEGDNEFFANDVLVHNCMDYMICSAFASEFEQFQNGSNPNSWSVGKLRPSLNRI